MQDQTATALPPEENATQYGPVQSSFANGPAPDLAQKNPEILSSTTRIRTDVNQRNGLVQQTNIPTMPREESISVAVDAVALITTECITVTSAMRKHARWAHSSVSAILGGSPSPSKSRETTRQFRNHEEPTIHMEMSSMGMGSARSDFLLGSRWGLRGKKGKSLQDDPLIAAFARLRNDLRHCTGMREWLLAYTLPLIELRYQDLRYPRAPTPLPPSHPLIFYISVYHFTRTRRDYKILRLQSYISGISQIGIGDANVVSRHYPLSFRSKRFRSR